MKITLLEGNKTKIYNLPFAVFRDNKISGKNRFSSITIDRELGNQAVSFALEDGKKGDFPADFVLYHCDSTYDWSPINQLKRVLKNQLGRSNLSVRVVADALKTSPSQVVRLLQENRGSKQARTTLSARGPCGISNRNHSQKEKSGMSDEGVRPF